MDYRPTYRSLLELFPQVDSRILKAVAIEHLNDIHAAVEFILYEVLPSLGGPSDASYPVHDSHDVANEDQLREHNVYNQGAEALQPESIICGTAISDESASFPSPFSGVDEENIIDVERFKTNEVAEVERLETSKRCSSLSNLEELPYVIGYGSLVKDINKSVSECEEQLSRCSVECADTTSVALESAKEMSSTVNEKSMDSLECGDEFPTNINGSYGANKDHHKHLAENHSELLASGTEMVSLEDHSMIQSTQFGHVINLDLLEDYVTDAKSNKKYLVSTLESVDDMMREVEILEERVKQAKEEASSASQDILKKVEDLEQMLQHAKEANDMHAGEVYGEKAILSTEARELQTRLLHMSDERNKSFTVIEEIRETLEARLAAAKDEIAASEQEKLEKEVLVNKALKEQEAFMDTIVQEAKRLQHEAEENAKLREFLVDRGRVVDTLQGEIAVICEDVMLIKKRVDDHLPLERSLLMRTYSSASTSSSSTHKSIHSANGLVRVDLGENSRETSEDLSRNQDQEKIINVNGSKEADASGKQKSTSDDDWEFLKHEACLF